MLCRFHGTNSVVMTRLVVQKGEIMQLEDQNVINDKWDTLTDMAENCIYGVVKQAQDHAYQLGLKRGMADAVALEKQYATQLGRMAELCATVIPWLVSVMSDVTDEAWPQEVRDGYIEIMDYVGNVRP